MFHPSYSPASYPETSTIVIRFVVMYLDRLQEPAILAAYIKTEAVIMRDVVKYVDIELMAAESVYVDPRRAPCLVIHFICAHDPIGGSYLHINPFLQSIMNAIVLYFKGVC